MDEDLQAFFRWCEEEEIRMQEWLNQVAEEDSIFWEQLLSVPVGGDIE